jgi:hypothetical protein
LLKHTLYGKGPPDGGTGLEAEVDQVARLITVGCCIAALAACGAQGTSAAPTTAAASTTAAPTTSVAASTTSAPTTTLSPRQQDEAEIREIHDRFFELMVAGEPNPDNPAYAEVMTGIELQRTAESDRAALEAGQHFEGAIEGSVLQIEFADSQHATVRVCTTTDDYIIGQDGTVVAHDARPPFVTSLQMLRTSVGWRVADWLTGGQEPCGS